MELSFPQQISLLCSIAEAEEPLTPENLAVAEELARRIVARSGGKVTARIRKACESLGLDNLLDSHAEYPSYEHAMMSGQTCD